MIRFRLYCTDYPDGFLLASCADENTAYVLNDLYKRVYSPGRFQVTVQRPYKAEEEITRFDCDFVEAHPNIGWLPRSKKSKKR